MSSQEKSSPSDRKTISKTIQEKIIYLQQTEHLFMIVCAVLIGLIAGYGAVGIRWLIETISHLAFPGEVSFLDRVAMIPWYWKILIPAIGGLIVGPLIYFFAPEAKGHGVPEVMQAVIQRKGIIRPRVAFVKAIASAITIGTGGSVGREGPIIQIGSSLGSTLGQILKIPTNRMKTLVGCGAAAGIAAAFNAPIAGALFALEIIIMEFTAAQLTPIVISSVLATVISHTFEGDIAAFQIEGAFNLVTNWEILFYFPLGALSGLVSWIFIKVLYFSEDLWDEKFKIPSYIKPAIGGLIIGALAIFFPQIMGVGYKSITATMDNTLAQITNIEFLQQNIWFLALLLIVLKLFATSITLGSGGSGGVFAPSLFMGAMTGALYGYFIHIGFPTSTSTPGMYALIAMAGLVAGTTRAPLTAIIIVFEMTKQISIILPLMITTTLSMVISAKLSRESIYTLKLLNRNINIKGRTDINILKSLDIKDIYKQSFESIPENTNFSDMIEILLNRNVHYISVHTLEGKFAGIVTLNNVKSMIYEKDELKFLMIAGDTANKNVPRITEHHNAKEALDMMNKFNVDTLPVMDAENPEVQIGVIRHRDIDDAYYNEIERLDMTYDLASKISDSKMDKDVQIYGGFGLSEINIPEEFIGKSLKDLQIRNKYGVDIISIKSPMINTEVKTIPSADHVFSEGESLIVCGKLHDINILKGRV
jgi:CIC family chloride channel protein